ncbi:MAG: ABC transporter permease [ANME-2 cluster archaeon]|nr:ABC transporter permease [ANME-2 cluster archaeon]
MKNRVRTTLNIAAVTIAVLSVILLASLGSGLVSTGEQVFQKSNMHLWITGKPIDLQTRYANPGEAKLNNAHSMADDILKDSRINVSTPMLTEMVYASGNNEQLKAIFGLGVATGGPMVVISEGINLNPSSHYNGGTYDGPMTQEVLVDSRAAALLNVSLGDTIHVGKTMEDATNQEFRVVGLTNSLTTFSINPMLIFPLSEFQDMTGNHYYDSASMILIRLSHPDDADAVSQDLKEQYPDYVVNTNTDLLEKIIQENSMVLGSAVSMVLLAVVMGGALVINTMLLSINEKRKEIGIMQVIGMSRWSMIKSMGLEGLIISILGGMIGCLLSIPSAALLNHGIESILGFEKVLVLDDIFLIGGFAMALTLGIVSTVAAIWRLDRIRPIEQLRSI